MRRRSRAVSLEMAAWMDVREGKRMCRVFRRPRHSSDSGRQWCVLSYLLVRFTSCVDTKLERVKPRGTGQDCSTGGQALARQCVEVLHANHAVWIARELAHSL